MKFVDPSDFLFRPVWEAGVHELRKRIYGENVRISVTALCSVLAGFVFSSLFVVEHGISPELRGEVFPFNQVLMLVIFAIMIWLRVASSRARIKDARAARDYAVLVHHFSPFFLYHPGRRTMYIHYLGSVVMNAGDMLVLPKGSDTVPKWYYFEVCREVDGNEEVIFISFSYARFTRLGNQATTFELNDILITIRGLDSDPLNSAGSLQAKARAAMTGRGFTTSEFTIVAGEDQVPHLATKLGSFII